MPNVFFEHIGKLSSTGSPDYLDSVYDCDYYSKGGNNYLAVVSFEDNSLSIINVTDPANPVGVSSIRGTGAPNWLDGACSVKTFNISGHYYAVVVAYNDNSLGVFDIDTPATPTLVGSIQGSGTPKFLGGAFGVYLQEISAVRYAFVASSEDDSLTIVSLAVLAVPAVVGHLSGTGTPNYLEEIHDVKVFDVNGTWYAFCTGYKDNSLTIVDVSVPATPTLTSSIQGSGSPNFLGGSHSVDLYSIDSNVYAFVTGFYDNSLVVIDVEDPTTPVVSDVFYGAGIPDYMNSPTKIRIINMGVGYTYAIISSYSDNSLVAIRVDDPTNIYLANYIEGIDYPNFLDGIRGFYVASGYLYAMLHDIDTISIFSMTLEGTNCLLTGTSSCIVTSEAIAGVGGDVNITGTTAISLKISVNTEADSNRFLGEIAKPHWFPKVRAYAIDINNKEVDISSYVKDFGKITWQIEQQYHINVFTSNNVSMELKNEENKFDIDNANNFFVETLGREQDGNKIPIIIKGGYVVESEEILIPLFYGLIVNIVPSTNDDITRIYLQCISRDLKDTKCVNVGDQWTNERLYGGYTYTEITSPLLTIDPTHLNTNFVTVSGHGFPDSFPDSGYIKIGDECIYYGEKGIDGFYSLIRGVNGTTMANHYVAYGHDVAYGNSINTKAFLVLNNGEDTGTVKFQFPIFPISKQSITNVITSEGHVTVHDDMRIEFNRASLNSNLHAYVNYDSGILEFVSQPSDPTSVRATFKTVPQTVAFHSLAKMILKGKNYDTSLIDNVQFASILADRIPVVYGRVTHTNTYMGSQSVTANIPCNAICCDDTSVYLGVGGHLIKWSGGEFEELAFLGDNKIIMNLGLNAGGIIYGIVRKDDPIGDVTNGDLFSYSNNIVTYLVTDRCAYYQLGYTIAKRHIKFNIGQWKGFSVDDGNGCVWFLYENSYLNRGVARIDFDGTNLIIYKLNDVDPFSGYEYIRGTDFVDCGDTIEVFYVRAFHLVSPPSTTYELRCFAITKSTGLWTYRGTISNTLNFDFGDPMITTDITYNSSDGNIYMNIMSNVEDDNWEGVFIYLTKGTTSINILSTYDSPYGIQSKFSGGVFFEDYVWFIKGTELAIGQDESAEEVLPYSVLGYVKYNLPIDNSDGHLYRIVNGIIEDMGAVAYRPTRDGRKEKFLRNSVKGVSCKLAVRSSDSSIWYISSDATVSSDPKFGYTLGSYSRSFYPVIRVANINDMSMWDVLAEIAKISNNELGVNRNGKVFLRERTIEKTFTTAVVSSVATTVNVETTSGFSSSGYIQIDGEVIAYTGITATSFTGCTRGTYNSIPAGHNSKVAVWQIDSVFINMEGFNTLKYANKSPNYAEIYNYVQTTYGDKLFIFDYSSAGENFAGSSEQLYGRKSFDISSPFLTNDDYTIVETLSFRVYDYYSKRRSLIEVETKWQPQIDLGNVVSIKQNTRVNLDYVISRLRRIEIDLKNFFVRGLSLGDPTKIREDIYQFDYDSHDYDGS